MHAPLSAALRLGSLLAACGGQPEPAALDQLVTRYGEDPSGAVAALEALPDPRDRMIAVEALALRYGLVMLERGGCEAFGQSALRARCAELLERAHLYTERPTASGEGALLRGPGCDEGSSPALCARAAALAALEAGEAEPHRHCAEVPAEALRHECAFELAEHIIQQRGERGYGLAVDACLAAGPFQPNCLDHASAQLARRALRDAECPCVIAGADCAYGDLAAVEGTLAGFWKGRDTKAGTRAWQVYRETLDFERLLAAGELDPVPVEPPAYGDRVVVVRWAIGGQSLGGELEGPGADPARLQAARLASLAGVLGELEADVVSLHQLDQPSALQALQRATACLTGRHYPYLQLSAPEHGVGVLSRFPLSLDPEGIGVQLSKGGPAELRLPWAPSHRARPSGAWDEEGSIQEVALPSLLDEEGRPRPWNPGAKRGTSSSLPQRQVLVRAAGAPR